MKITLTGSSSTGKTTLSKALMANAFFASTVRAFVTTDARRILTEMGHTSMDLMKKEETRIFQLKYFEKKANLESELADFLTDRSFVDVAAYWVVRDSEPGEERDNFVRECRKQSSHYDVHFYLPTGVIPFESDGYRSEDMSFHKKIDLTIKGILDDWRIPYVTLGVSDLDQRVQRVLDWVKCSL